MISHDIQYIVSWQPEMQDFFFAFFVQFLHLVTYAKEYFTGKFVRKKSSPHLWNIALYWCNYKHDFNFEGILFNLPKYLGLNI